MHGMMRLGDCTPLIRSLKKLNEFPKSFMHDYIVKFTVMTQTIVGRVSGNAEKPEAAHSTVQCLKLV